MSVLIKDMDMPISCYSCELRNPNGFWCRATEREVDILYERQPFCPLVPIPPHGRLGDLDRLEQMLVDIDNAPYSGFDGTEPFYSAEDAARIIRLAPTVIPADKEGEG